MDQADILPILQKQILLLKKGIKKIYNLSHREKGHIETDECAFITYESAK
jgi:hypothetical protein